MFASLDEHGAEFPFFTLWLPADCGPPYDGYRTPYSRWHISLTSYGNVPIRRGSVARSINWWQRSMITMDDNECAGTIHRSLPSDDPDEIRPWLCAGPSDRDLAKAYAEVHNRVWCLYEEDISDEDTESWELLERQMLHQIARRWLTTQGISWSAGWWIDDGRGEVYEAIDWPETSSCPSTRRSVGCACALTASLWCRVPSGSRVPRAHTLPATPLTETGA